MLLNASPLNAGLLNAGTGAAADPAGVFRPASVLLPVIWGAPAWMVKQVFEVPSLAAPLVVGAPTLVLGTILRFAPESVGPLLQLGMPAWRLSYQGGLSPGAQAFYPRSVTNLLTLGTPARAGYRAFAIPTLAGLLLGTPRSLRVFSVSSVAASLLPSPAALVQRLNAHGVATGLAVIAPSLVRVFRPVPLPGLRLGQPRLSGLAGFTPESWSVGISVGVPDLRSVHRVYPTSRTARLGQPALHRGHAC